MTIYVLLLNCLLVLLIGIAQAVLPACGRRTIFFSVTVPEHFRETKEARALLRDFRWLILGWTILAEIVMVASIDAAIPWLQLAAFFVLIAGATGAYARERSQTLPYAVAPSSERFAQLAPPSVGLVGSYIALAVAVVPFIAAALFAWSHWSRIPDTRALWNAFAVNGTMDALLLLLGVAILHGARRGSPLRWVNLTVIVAFLSVFSAATAIFTALRWINPAEHFSDQLFPVTILTVFIGIITWALRKASQLRDGSDTTPDECWKLGQFYYNPEDPAWLVERRFGLGYTPNFAKPKACIATAVFFLLPIMAIASLTIAHS